MNAPSGEALTVVAGCLDELLQFGLAHALENDRSVRVLACNLDPRELEQVAATRSPNVVIVDSAADYWLLARLQAQARPPAIVALTSDQGRLFRTTLLAAGITCLPPDASVTRVVKTLHMAARASVAAKEGRDVLSVSQVPTHLTDREIDVLAYLRRGALYAEVAQALSISESTVKTHAARLKRKLGVKSKRELIGIPLPRSNA